MSEEQPEKKPDEKKPEAKYLELIQKADAASERLEKANKEREALLEKEARLKVERSFEGETSAGERKPEETPEQYKDRVMGGLI